MGLCARTVGGLTSVRYTLLAAAIILADQATKYWVRLFLPIGAPKPVIPGIVYFTHVQNTGAAFGLLRGYTPLLILITMFVLVVTLVNRAALARGETPPPTRLLIGPCGGDRQLHRSPRVWPCYRLYRLPVLARLQSGRHVDLFRRAPVVLGDRHRSGEATGEGAAARR